MTPTALQVMEEVADSFGITTDDILSRSRIARRVNARAVAAFILTRHLGLSTTEAGALMQRDHGTIIHYVRKVDGMKQWPTMYRADLNLMKAITDKLFGHETMDGV